MTTTLITGANKGLGYETARRLIGDGHDVWMAARDPERGQRAADQLGGRYVQLDVTDEESVRAATDRVAAETGLDVLINNAGLSGGRIPPGETTVADMRRVYDTNVFGIVRVIGAFLPVLRHSSAPVIVNVSSGMGSLAATHDPERLEYGLVQVPYTSSKAAVNMITTQYAKAFPDIRINAVDPGYTSTDFNERRGTQTVEEGAEVIVRMAELNGEGPSGAFLDARGTAPW